MGYKINSTQIANVYDNAHDAAIYMSASGTPLRTVHDELCVEWLWTEELVAHWTHSRLIDGVCSSPTLVADTMANKKAVFNDTHLSSMFSRGSDGFWHSTSNTSGRSQEGV